MKERPILFSGPMVRAILAGTKTQTRRPLDRNKLYNGFAFDDPRIARACPYGQPGERLWVRETWQINHIDYDRGLIPKERPIGTELLYRADGEFSEQFEIDEGRSGWRPSIHMPRWASRIDLEITAVRVEQVQDISEADIKAEGFDRIRYRGYTSTKIDDPEDFSDAWDAIYAKRGYSWASNPWVWVVEFKAVQR